MKEDVTKATPMMKQFLELKQQYSDCVLLFRAGDFYETFYDDAKLCSQVLGITLTKRSNIPMAGVPFHSVTPYIRKLVQNNYKVAICEQLEDPKKAKGLVKRGITRIITPGTILEDEYLTSVENNFIMCIYSPKNISEKYGIALVDITTGEFFTSEIRGLEDIKTIVRKYSPNEILMNESSFAYGLKEFIKNTEIYYNFLSDIRFNLNYANEILKKQFGHKGEELGLDQREFSIIACGALLFYIYKLQKLDLSHVNKIRYMRLDNNMILDSVSLRNLEIVESLFSNNKGKTLFGILNNTKTAAGSRMLRSHMINPLLEVVKINNRLDAVEELSSFVMERDEIREALEEFADIERITSRINSGIASPKDLYALKVSLQKIPELKSLLRLFQSKNLKRSAKIDALPEIVNLLDRAIVEDGPSHMRDIGFIKKDFNSQLKELFEIAFNSKDFICELEESERLRSGINTLKIRYNKVFGYYIEVPKAQTSRVPEDYEVKQTLVNAQRYIKPELKEKEDQILNAEDKIKALEIEIFEEILRKLRNYTKKFQQIAKRIALLDVYCCHSLNAQMFNYVRPEFSEEKCLIVEGRNPIVERFVSNFIANDTVFNNDESLKIITGPNMSGKCLVGNSIIFTDKGMLEIEKFKPENINEKEFKKIKLSISSRNGIDKVSHFYYDGMKPTIKIKTRFGFEIEGTLNHPLLVREENGNEVWKKISEIVGTDYLIVSRKNGLFGSKVEIDENILSRINNYQRVKKYLIPSKIDGDLGYLIGLLIGDGTLTYRNSLNFTNADKDLIEEFGRIIHEKFNYKLRAKQNKKDYFVSSVQIREFFREIGLEHKNSLTKEVPICILEAPADIVKSFVSGLLDTDGDVNKKGDVALSTSSKKLAKQFQLILLNFGIIGNLSKKKTKVNLNYTITINGEDAIKFHREIGFKLKRKAERSKLCSKLRMPNYAIPYLNPILKEIQKRIVSKKDKKVALKRVKNINSIFYSYIPLGRNLSYRKLKQLMEYCNLNEVNCREIKEIVNNNYHYEKIVLIEKSEELKKVYDLSVPKSHSFVANGIVSHNSTYLRQNALLSLMGQIGSFVPAQSACLKIYDRIFTRIGAHDELSEGQSTFMVEMCETANILNNATSDSLVLLDEIGRGTSTYDGLSIAWAVTEELAEIGCDSIFATHYHQLNKLSDFYSNIENYNVLVREEGERVEFVRQIVKGGTDKSYGIYVGKLAGIPSHVLDRAREVQVNIEEKEEIRIRKEFKESLEKRDKGIGKKRKQRDERKEKGLGGFI